MSDLSQPWEIPFLFPNWRIEGLLTDGDPIMDTGVSAQLGYVGTAIYREGKGLRTMWDYPTWDDDGNLLEERTWMITSTTWGTGLNLMKRAGRNRALEWICQTNGWEVGSSGPLFGPSGRAQRWKIITSTGIIHFVADSSVQPSGDVGVLAQVVIPGLADLDRNDPTRLEDGSKLVDAQAVGLITEFFADQVDPEWRERYTPDWWKAKRAQGS
jgi:hypothetical protein